MIAAIVAALLLVFPSLASAECAWVLWESITTTGVPSSDQTRIAGGFEKRQDCIEAARRSYLVSGAPPDTATTLVENPGRSWFRKRPDGGDVILQNRCLPDTIDPREPKGGGR